uniref:Thymocyte nuclear protein 1 n=1 Tax=Neogobius melanostomus TaxID=47308 RepID=A0A8C6WIR3_9GOBI
MPPKKRTRSSKSTAESGINDASKTTGSRRKAAGSVKNGNKDTADTAPEYSHWLMKSEPESRFENGIDVKFGIEDLKALPDQTGCWDGVRNYQARNFMRQMKEGHLAFFYHSNCKEPGVAGLMKVDPFDPYQDLFFFSLPHCITTSFKICTKGGPLKNLALFTRARLSVQPLTKEEFDYIQSLEDKEPFE